MLTFVFYMIIDVCHQMCVMNSSDKNKMLYFSWFRPIKLCVRMLSCDDLTAVYYFFSGVDIFSLTYVAIHLVF